MKTFVRFAAALVAIAVVCQVSLALAKDYYWVSGGDQAGPAGSEAPGGEARARRHVLRPVVLQPAVLL